MVLFVTFYEAAWVTEKHIHHFNLHWKDLNIQTKSNEAKSTFFNKTFNDYMEDTSTFLHLMKPYIKTKEVNIRKNEVINEGN